MQEMELYHIHKKNDMNKKWIEKGSINVDNKFDSVMNQRQQNFSQAMYVDGDKLNYDIYLAQYFQKIKDLKIIKKEELEELKELLKIGYQMSFNANFFKREAALEDCRKEHYLELPSRLHCIYLCDYDGLEYWNDTISKNGNEEVEVFKVLATGKIFKTNEQLLPNETGNYGETYNASFKYWNPKFKDVPNYTNEYLTQGTIKILNKVK